MLTGDRDISINFKNIRIMKKRFSLSLLALLLAGNVTSIVCANHVVLYDYRSSFSTELVSDD